MSAPIASGSQVLIDTNVLYAHFVDLGNVTQACTELLDRVASRDLQGHVTPRVMGDLQHKLMVAEGVRSMPFIRRVPLGR